MEPAPSGNEPKSWDDLLRLTNGFTRLITECQRAIDTGLDAPDATTLALNLWATVHGMVSLRICMPQLDWPPVEQQLELLGRQMRATLRR